jgi:CrcB protein
MTMLLVALGACTDRVILARRQATFPWGAFTVNMAGSLLLGYLIGAPAGPWLSAALGTGFYGALTTSPMSGRETLRLVREGDMALTAAYAIGSVLAGLGAAYGGLLLAQAPG